MLLNGLQSNPDVPGTEKFVVTSVDDKWLLSKRMTMSASDLGLDRTLLPPQAVFAVKCWNRCVCTNIIMLACMENKELLEARFPFLVKISQWKLWFHLTRVISSYKNENLQWWNLCCSWAKSGTPYVVEGPTQRQPIVFNSNSKNQYLQKHKFRQHGIPSLLRSFSTIWCTKIEAKLEAMVNTARGLDCLGKQYCWSCPLNPRLFHIIPQKVFAICWPGVSLTANIRRRPNAFNLLHQMETMIRGGLSGDATLENLQARNGIHFKISWKFFQRKY